MSVPQPSTREAIAEVLLTRMQQATVANGFNTDAGEAVVLGEPVSLGDEDPDVVIAMLVGDAEQPRWQGEHIFYVLPYEFQAVAKAGRTDSWRMAEQGLQDIKRAIELSDRRLGNLLTGVLERGAVSTIARAPGSELVGISITYWAPIQELWGDP